MFPAAGMHMGNELLSEPVAGVTLVAAGAAVVLAARAARSLDADRLPLMGVLGAFVFAAQMINFTILPGVSGHLTGSVLLALLLGPSAAIVTMTAILIIQCLLFQDGGLLALGCNVLNMAVVPCLLGWWVCRAVVGKAGRRRLCLGTSVACVAAVTAGAALVPLEAGLSNVLQVPVRHFLIVMVGLHVLIGGVEAFITMAVIAYLRRVRPGCLTVTSPSPGRRGRLRWLLASLVLVALVLAGLASWFASSHPDGLEAASGRAVAPVSGIRAAVDDWQARWTLLTDYSKRSAPLGRAGQPPGGATAYPNVDGWGSVAGILGTLVTLAVLYALAGMLRRKAGGASA